MHLNEESPPLATTTESPRAAMKTQRSQKKRMEGSGKRPGGLGGEQGASVTFEGLQEGSSFPAWGPFLL